MPWWRRAVGPGVTAFLFPYAWIRPNRSTDLGRLLANLGPWRGASQAPDFRRHDP